MQLRSRHILERVQQAYCYDSGLIQRRQMCLQADGSVLSVSTFAKYVLLV
jgi:hypothetical protein